MKQLSIHINDKEFTIMPNPDNHQGTEWHGYAKVHQATLSLSNGRVTGLSIHRFGATNCRPNDVTFEIGYTHRLYINNGTAADPDWDLVKHDSNAVVVGCAEGANINHNSVIGDIDNWRDTSHTKPAGQKQYKLETYTKVTPKAGFTDAAGEVKAELDVIETFG